MNFIKQNALTDVEFMDILKLECTYQRTLIDAIVRIVEGNGGKIDLTITNDKGEIDFHKHSIRMDTSVHRHLYAYEFTPDGLYILTKDGTTIYAEYEDMELKVLDKILFRLYNFEIKNKNS